MATTQRPIAIAPAVNGRESSQQRPDQPTMAYSCAACARRKVKCDKIAPACSTCRKTKVECEYQAPAPRKRRRKATDEDVLERLERYEALLKDHGLLTRPELTPTPTDGDDNTPQSAHTALTRRTDDDGLATTGKLLAGHGKTRWIDNSLWRTLGDDDLNHSSDEDEAGPGQPSHTVHRASHIDPVSAAIIGGLGSQPLDLLNYHPTYDAALKMFKAYVDNVDPIVRLIHVPTGREMVQRAASNPSSMSKVTECLLFAIYHFAVYSMQEEECDRLLSQSRATLLSRYYDALRQALVNVMFLRTTDFRVLQAFTLFLMSVRNWYDHNSFWILTGVAVRIAQRMGLHRDGDGTGLGLNPFDVQMRARLFWQLLPLDGIASQLCGTGISIGLEGWDTKAPINVNDVDIWPDMTQPPQVHEGATDMIFCLARSEVGRFQKEAKIRLAPWSSVTRLSIPDEAGIQAMLQSIDGLESLLESRYLRYCDWTEPIHCMAMAMGRGSVAAARFRVHLHRDKTYTDAERIKVSTLAMKILEYNYIAQTNPILRRFKWHLQAVFQWDPVVWVLNDLRRPNPVLEPPTVWRQIEKIFEAHPDFLVRRRALHLAVGRMMLKAWAATVAESQTLDPPFIASIRVLVATPRDEKPAQAPPPPSSSSFPLSDAPEDLPITFDDGALANEQNVFDYTILDDLSPDGIDWQFWDQLAQEQTG